ncbi:MAG: putative haloacid dehalogenase-like hydrolase [Solirubrobacterales bacterium]|nr:putative haloacid dehalogenase-like hydrolase [Solirubrobacterales bacterium]
MAPPPLVIFDCDGVLVDSEPISNGVLAAMLLEQGWELTLPEARALFQGLLLEQVRAVAEQHLGRPLPPDWLEEYVSRRAVVFDAELLPVHGARELVELVAGAGAGVCVASQGSLAKTARSLALTGLADLFADHARFSAAQVPRGKPHPDLFLHAAATLGVAPSDCAVVEDTPSGVTAAVRAGMTAYGFCADSDERALREAGARTARSLEQIGELLVPAG